jgi:hypothetical protein
LPRFVSHALCFCAAQVGAEEGVKNITETARRELGDNVVLVVQVFVVCARAVLLQSKYCLFLGCNAP